VARAEEHGRGGTGAVAKMIMILAGPPKAGSY
jgi:hypothetical protein